MNLAAIELSARNRYNAVGDTNWSSAEICQIVYEACLEITTDVNLVIEQVYETSTVAGTGEYDFPSLANSITRVTVNGLKLKKISMRQDDVLTIENQLSVDTGVPAFWWEWARVIHMRPFPADVQTIQVFASIDEDQLTPASIITMPARFHGDLVGYVIKEMAAKDLNWQMYDRYQMKWEKAVPRIRSAIRRSKRADAFAVTQIESQLPTNYIGIK